MTPAECLEILRAVKSTSTDVCDENGQRMPPLERAIDAAAEIIAEWAEMEDALRDGGTVGVYYATGGRFGAYREEPSEDDPVQYSAFTLPAAILAALKGAGKGGKG